MRPRLPSALAEGLLFFLLASAPFAFGCVEPWSRAALEVLACLTALVCFLRGREVGPAAAHWGWLLPGAVALLGALQVFGAAPADGPRPPWPSTASLHDTESAVLLWAAYAAVVYSVPRVVTTASAARRFAWLVFALGLGVAGVGLLQTATSKDLIYWIRPTTPDMAAFGPYYDHDHAANLMLMSAAAGLGLLWSRVSRWDPVAGPLRHEVRGAFWEAAGVLTLVACVVLANSRSGLLAAALGGAASGLAAAAFAQRASSRRRAIVAALAAFAFIELCAFAYVVGGDAAGAPLDRSVALRMQIYADALRWFRDFPLYGAGLGSFSAVFPAYQDQALRGLVLHAHSDWLEFLLETGVFGAVPALCAFLGLLALWTASWTRARSREMRALIGGALAAVLVFAAHSLFEFNFQIPANAALFWALAGYLLSAPAWADKGGVEARSTPPPAGAAAAAVAFCAFACWSALLPAAADRSARSLDEATPRAARLLSAMDRDDDPAFVQDLSREAYRSAVDSPEENPVFLRAALYYALDAAALRPYSSSSLYLAGASLWRLKRPGDAREFLAREALVSFGPYRPARTPAPDWPQRKADELKRLELLRPAGRAR